MSTENRLYVGNLADDTSASALRRRFEQCGNVADVQLAFDRGSGRMRGFAFVTMADAASYKSALTQLNGAMFEDRQIRVTESNESGDDGAFRNQESNGGGRGKKDIPPRRAKITSQFRERTCMAYELDCAGTKIGIKMYPSNTPEGAPQEWRIEAIAVLTPDTVITATASTRKAAFDDIEKQWGTVSDLDWRAIQECLESVRAI